MVFGMKGLVACLCEHSNPLALDDQEHPATWSSGSAFGN